MTQIEKLEKVLANLEAQAEGFNREAAFCRKHNFLLEAGLFEQKWRLLHETIQTIRLTVIKELIDA